MRSTRHPLAILITVPHASYFVPAELRRLMGLTEREIKAQSDLYTDEIFEVPKAYVVKAKISRLVADPNRAPDDIASEINLMADGVVVSVTEWGKPIYKKPPGMKAIQERIKKYHDTFHAEIERWTPKVKFLIDGHSLYSHGPSAKDDAGKPRADVVLGNRDFTTCNRQTTMAIKEFFENQGFTVSINKPYQGKYVIGYHCSRRGLPGIQIEFNRKLYMNEKTLQPYPKKIRQLNKIMIELTEFLSQAILREREN